MKEINPTSSIEVTQVVAILGKGVKLAFSSECRLFVIVPIFINLIVLMLGGYLVFNTIYAFLNSYIDALPEFLTFLSYIIGFLLFISIGFVFCYIFSTVATIIASPFYGILSQKVERIDKGLNSFSQEDDSWGAVIKDIPRVIKRELTKLGYYLPKALICLIVSFVPVLNIISPVLWFMLAAWMMCIQYVDYAYDNHKIDFKQMRAELSYHRFSSFSFGAVICILMTIPIINIFIPPISVCSGTLYFIELEKRYRLGLS